MSADRFIVETTTEALDVYLFFDVHPEYRLVSCQWIERDEHWVLVWEREREGAE